MMLATSLDSDFYSELDIYDIEIPVISAYFYKDPKYSNERLGKIFLFYRYLCKHIRFSGISSENKHEIIKNLEKTCYVNTIEKAKKQDVDCKWSNEDFEFIYHTVCANVLSHLSYDDAVFAIDVRSVESKLKLNTSYKVSSQESISFNDSLVSINRFINELIDDPSIDAITGLPIHLIAKEFPNRTQKELYPKHYKNILKRQTADQQIVVKTSQLHTCPRCKNRQSTVVNRYNRSLDEGVNQYATCYFCGCEWCC